MIPFGLAFVYCLYVYVYSFRAYDEKSYFYYLFNRKIIFLWKDVSLLFPIRGNFAVTIYFDDSKRRHALRLASYATRDYFKVLEEIVHHIKTENPGIKINPVILNQLTNHPKHTL